LGLPHEVLGAQGRVTHLLDDVILSKKTFFCFGGSVFLLIKTQKTFFSKGRFYQRRTLLRSTAETNVLSHEEWILTPPFVAENPPRTCTNG
jgi:hypothetical protein